MDEDHLNRADREIRDVLQQEGRATPRLISEQTNYSRVYVQQRLERLMAFDEVNRIDRGLYEWSNTYIYSGRAAEALDYTEQNTPGDNPLAVLISNRLKEKDQGFVEDGKIARPVVEFLLEVGYSMELIKEYSES